MRLANAKKNVEHALSLGRVTRTRQAQKNIRIVVTTSRIWEGKSLGGFVTEGDRRMAIAGAETNDLIQRAHGGDALAREHLFERHRERLLKMIAVRMDQRLRRRLDPSDVVQEVFAEAWKRIDDYFDRRPL